MNKRGMDYPGHCRPTAVRVERIEDLQEPCRYVTSVVSACRRDSSFAGWHMRQVLWYSPILSDSRDFTTTDVRPCGLSWPSSIVTIFRRWFDYGERKRKDDYSDDITADTVCGLAVTTLLRMASGSGRLTLLLIQIFCSCLCIQVYDTL